MKLKLARKYLIVICVFNAIFFISIKNSLAQSIELAGTYTTSDVDFYKNTPGISFAYSYHLKRQFVFVELKTSKKANNSFTSLYHNISDYHTIKSVNGSFSASSVDIGLAQKIITSNCLEFSVGVDAGLNYYKQDNEYISIGLNKDRNEILYFNNENEIVKRKNKFGIGAFIDMELKRIIFDDLSIFSRLNIYHSDYAKPIVLNNTYQTSYVNRISFRLGLKYRIPSAK